jgi:4-hydroxy-3-polyprenylbenzoate decarboxylase
MLCVSEPLPVPDRVVIGITGATGQVYGIRALELLETTPLESHLVLSESAQITMGQETEATPSDVEGLADVVHAPGNIGAPIASGSFETLGTLVAPCSMKTLANVANGNAESLIPRTADVTLKERRPLVLMPREKPLNRIHLQNMLTLTDAGGIIVPPFLSFYQRNATLDEMITRTVSRALELLDVPIEYAEWDGLN